MSISHIRPVVKIPFVEDGKATTSEREQAFRLGWLAMLSRLEINDRNPDGTFDEEDERPELSDFWREARSMRLSANLRAKSAAARGQLWLDHQLEIDFARGAFILIDAILDYVQAEFSDDRQVSEIIQTMRTRTDRWIAGGDYPEGV